MYERIGMDAPGADACVEAIPYLDSEQVKLALDVADCFVDGRSEKEIADCAYNNGGNALIVGFVQAIEERRAKKQE